jgi:hypothetical protein
MTSNAIQKQQQLELPRASSWDDPNIEADVATSAWDEETRRAVEDCCAERACRICVITKVAEPVKARLRADSVVDADGAILGQESKTAPGRETRCA